MKEGICNGCLVCDDFTKETIVVPGDAVNLYAAGECCAQYHGANRLGGNSLLGALYGGKIAAQTACEDELIIDAMRTTDTKEPTEYMAAISRSEKNRINIIMEHALWVIRNQKTMEKGLQQLQENLNVNDFGGKSNHLEEYKKMYRARWCMTKWDKIDKTNVKKGIFLAIHFKI